MQHPLVNPSLAPFGFVFPLSVTRLNYHPHMEGAVNSERIIARCWDKANRASAPHPLPVQAIIHEILPGLAAANRVDKGNFTLEGLPYLSRDIQLLSTVMQWLATNVGGYLLESDISRQSGYHPEREFRMKLANERKKKTDLNYVAMWVHVCTKQCSEVRHRFDSEQITPRDRAVVDGLMYWLGSLTGRAFTSNYLARRHAAFDAQRAARRKQQALRAA